MAKRLYSQTPVVSAKQIAGTNPIPGPTLGKGESSLTPTKEPHLLGLGQATHVPHHNVKGSKLGTPHGGHLKLSGHPGAHQLGKRK